MPARPTGRVYLYVGGAALVLVLVVLGIVILGGAGPDSGSDSTSTSTGTSAPTAVTTSAIDGIAAVQRTYPGCVSALHAHDWIQGGNVVTAQSDDGPLAWDISGTTPTPTDSTAAVLDEVGCV